MYPRFGGRNEKPHDLPEGTSPAQMPPYIPAAKAKGFMAATVNKLPSVRRGLLFSTKRLLLQATDLSLPHFFVKNLHPIQNHSKKTCILSLQSLN